MAINESRGIKIKVQTEYVPDQSDPEHNRYFFAYHITILNEGYETVQLLNRHWIITNSEGKREEVKGPGVVGEQPILGPGESFEYTSFCPLTTSLGTMHGSYQMIGEDKQLFDVEIPAFTLATESMTIH